MKINKLRVALYGTCTFLPFLFLGIIIVTGLWIIEYPSLLEYLAVAGTLWILWVHGIYPFSLFINYYIIDKDKYFHVDKDSKIITFKTKYKCKEMPLSDIKEFYWVKTSYRRHIAPYYFIITFHNHPPIILTSLMISIEKLEKELKTRFYIIETKNLFITDES